MNRNELRLEMMPLPPRVTVMVERQLNGVELRHDLERVRGVRVASLTVLLVWPSCRLVSLLPYRPTHYPPFSILRLYRYWFRRTRVLLESSTLLFSHSLRKCPLCCLFLR